jgi:hypothetical protein
MKTNPFAGLMAGFRGARADDDSTDDEEARKARRAEEDQRREEEDARRAEEDDRRNDEDARRAEEDDDSGNPPENGGKKGRKAKGEDQDSESDAEDGDDDAEDGMDDKEAAAYRRGLAVGRARENARGYRIFSNPAVAGRADFAATLAFTTRNTSAEADRLLRSTSEQPRGRRASLDDRMRERRDPRPGGDGGTRPAGTGSSVADQMIAVGRRLGQMPKD